MSSEDRQMAQDEMARRKRLMAIQAESIRRQQAVESNSGMQSFEVQGPDGTIYEVQAPDMQSAAGGVQGMTPDQMEALARAAANYQRKDSSSVSQENGVKTMADYTADQYRDAARKAMAAGDTAAAQRLIAAGRALPAPSAQTNMVEQSMSGVNEGIAGILGAPVDLVNGAFNLGKQGINALAGTDLQTTQNPFGGSETFRDLLSPIISDVAPQTTAQRYGRRVGQEVGAMAIPGGVAMRSAAAPLALAGMETASAIGSGIAGQTSQEIAPGNQTADMIASMLGGLSPVAASRSMRPSPKAPTLEQLQTESQAGYDAVRESGATLSPRSADALASGIEGTLGPRAATRKLNPKAAIAADELGSDLRQQPPSISDVDEIRQWIGKNVAGSNEAGERAIGMQMRGAIDSHLDGLTPADVTGTNRAPEVVDALKKAREKSHRIHKSQLFEAEDTGAFAKGLRRAATTGTGGNEVNAIRQNVRRVLENPKLRRGYNEAELQAMRDIADGTPTQNALRLIGRLAPTSGALPLGGFAGAAGASGATGNPFFMAPAIAGQGAKYLGERSTRKKIAELGEMIRNGKPLPKKTGSDLEKRLIAALLAKQTENAEVYGRSDDPNKAIIRGMLEQQQRIPTY